MLNAHLDAIEDSLLSQSKIQKNSGHSIHKGTPREEFIREFLSSHLGENLAIGSGEIIDANSKPGEKRNQIDIVIYKKNYPKLALGGNITCFLAESVFATIEVKSNLTKEEMKMSIIAANNIKQLKRSFNHSLYVGFDPPGILSYIVAYDGPKNMKTVRKWMGAIHNSEKMDEPQLNQASRPEGKFGQPSPSIDGVCVFGKGYLVFNNSPIRFSTANNELIESNWIWSNQPRGSLFWLFLFLTHISSAAIYSRMDPLKYLNSNTDGSKIPMCWDNPGER